MANLKEYLAHSCLRRLINTRLGGNRCVVRGRGNHLALTRALLTRVRIAVEGDDNRIEVGEGTRLANLDILVRGNGARLTIGAGCSIAAGKIKLEDDCCAVSLGDGTTVEDAYFGAYEGMCVEVGRDCMISEKVGIRSGDMHTLIDQSTGRRVNPSKSIWIGDHVWLARGVTVLKGVTIGANAVIGAQSLVTDDVPEDSLAVGSPARVIRQNVTWDRRRLAVAEGGSTRLGAS